MKKQTCLPGFGHYLGGRRRKDQLTALRQQIQAARHYGLSQLESLFEAVIPAAELDPFNRRKRLFCQRRTFWAYVGQVLGDGSSQGSLRDALRGIQALRHQRGENSGSSSTSALSQARRRLNPSLITRAHACLRRFFDAHQSEVEGFPGRRIRLVDSTTVTAADTPANQFAFPQSSQAKPGCGFPLVRITALFDLNSASLVKASITDYCTSELAGAVVDLLEELTSYDILVADRYYQNFGFIHSVLDRQADILVRVKNQMLRTFKPIKGQPRNGDRLVCIHKPQLRNELYEDTWEHFENTLVLRHISFVGRDRDGNRQTFHLLTSLTDAKAYPAHTLAALYARRWKIEVGFRDLKATMGMDWLRTKSPEMVEKDIAIFFIAYNLLRYLHLQCALRYEVPLEQLSIKGTIDTALRFAPLAYKNRLHQRKSGALFDHLLELISKDLIPHRLARSEPRKRKHRKRGKEWLTVPRSHYKKPLYPCADFELVPS